MARPIDDDTHVGHSGSGLGVGGCLCKREGASGSRTRTAMANMRVIVNGPSHGFSNLVQCQTSSRSKIEVVILSGFAAKQGPILRQVHYGA